MKYHRSIKALLLKISITMPHLYLSLVQPACFLTACYKITPEARHLSLFSLCLSLCICVCSLDRRLVYTGCRIHKTHRTFKFRGLQSPSARFNLRQALSPGVPTLNHFPTKTLDQIPFGWYLFYTLSCSQISRLAPFTYTSFM